MDVDLNEIISQLINNFDFAFMLTANIATYIIIKVLEGLKISCGEWSKRIVLLIVILLLSIAYYFTSNTSFIVLLNSAIAAPVFYSWALKPILKKIGAGYNKEIITDNINQ